MARKRKSARITHRTHPAKVFRAPPGHCQWCHVDLAIIEKPYASTKFCGRLCEDAYRLHTDPKVWRAEVWRRDRGICRTCGTKHPLNGAWEADHIIPLFIAGVDWNWWSPENGQVLCKSPCHEEKTFADKVRFGIDKSRRRTRR